ncbi:MAG TPA: phosphoglycerate mutase family protein [Candidatus Polarisedimenticolaceae bacterium]|nr:phosphoglycerate mutase family protein [Candidatus Polarisedimenticolaceae bacterium]
MILTTAVLAAHMTTVVLVRHAERTGALIDPGLTSAGFARADALAKETAGLHLNGVIVTDTKRTQETAAPSAREHHLTPVEVDKDDVQGAVAAIQRLPRSGAILVVSHNNKVGPIIEALGGPSVPDLCDEQFSTMYVLELPEHGNPRLKMKTYGAPDPPGAADCKQKHR